MVGSCHPGGILTPSEFKALLFFLLHCQRLLLLLNSHVHPAPWHFSGPLPAGPDLLCFLKAITHWTLETQDTSSCHWPSPASTPQIYSPRSPAAKHRMTRAAINILLSQFLVYSQAGLISKNWRLDLPLVNGMSFSPWRLVLPLVNRMLLSEIPFPACRAACLPLRVHLPAALCDTTLLYLVLHCVVERCAILLQGTRKRHRRRPRAICTTTAFGRLQCALRPGPPGRA